MVEPGARAATHLPRHPPAESQILFPLEGLISACIFCHSGANLFSPLTLASSDPFQFFADSLYAHSAQLVIDKAGYARQDLDALHRQGLLLLYLVLGAEPASLLSVFLPWVPWHIGVNGTEIKEAIHLQP